jgi:hypothetical protein
MHRGMTVCRLHSAHAVMAIVQAACHEKFAQASGRWYMMASGLLQLHRLCPCLSDRVATTLLLLFGAAKVFAVPTMHA